MHELKGNTMKVITKKLAVLFLAVGRLFGVSTGVFAQQTLSVTPSVTSNTYAGVITLAIGGLTNGERVVIQKYLDLNANGTIDPGEPLMDAFRIRDGGVLVMGGITNLNVPYDSNPVSGAITTTLNFPAAMPLENIVGQQIIQLLRPTGRFSPVTATFTVTNAALSQSVSGIIYSNGVPLANAVAVAQDRFLNNPVAAAVADSTGHYLLKLNPSSYALIAGMPNYYFDQSQAPSVVLTNGASATNSLFLTNGTVAISGSVYDAANSNALGGALLTLQSGNFFAISFTDSNGNYSAAVAPSYWKIQPAKERLAMRDYLHPEGTLQVDTTTRALANVGIALPPGTALFYR